MVATADRSLGPRETLNAGLDARRAIDIHEGDRIDARAFNAPVREASKTNAN